MRTIVNHLLFLSAAVIALPSANAGPLKVYVLCGQSNMQGHAQTKTLEHLGLDPATEPMLKKIRDAEGDDRVFEDIWISSLGSSAEVKQGQLTTGYGAGEGGPLKIGPELTFGIFMHEHVNEPILIIKTAWGGKSLHTDFRPPSAGQYQFNPTEIERLKEQGKDLDDIRMNRQKLTGVYYRKMVTHVKEVLADIRKVYPGYREQDGYELAGLVWFQGWNDMVDRNVYPQRDKPGGYDEYSNVLCHFIRDIRNDLGTPELPIVIGVMGVGGPVKDYDSQRQRHASTHREFRRAMAAPANMQEFKPNVVAVMTEQCWDSQLAELVDRRSQVQQLQRRLKKDPAVTRESREAAVSQLQQGLFTDKELKILEAGVSNAEYHYLGSAKIMTQIGRLFADALWHLDH